MEKSFTKEEILALNDDILDYVKLKRKRKVFSMVAILAAISGTVYAAKFLGIDESTLNSLISLGMVANGITATTFIRDITRKTMMIKPIEMVGEKIQNGIATEEEYFKSLPNLYEFVNVTKEEIDNYRREKGKSL